MIIAFINNNNSYMYHYNKNHNNNHNKDNNNPTTTNKYKTIYKIISCNRNKSLNSFFVSYDFTIGDDSTEKTETLLSFLNNGPVSQVIVNSKYIIYIDTLYAPNAFLTYESIGL